MNHRSRFAAPARISMPSNTTACPDCDLLLAYSASLAAPGDGGKVIVTGHHFILHERAEPAWLTWTPYLSGRITSNNQPPTTSR